MIRCRLHDKGRNHDLGWWQFAALPRIGDVIKIGLDAPAYYEVAFIVHTPVMPEEVSEYRPPFATVTVELLGKNNPVEKPE